MPIRAGVTAAIAFVALLGAPLAVRAQEQSCTTAALVAARPVLQQMSRSMAECLQARRSNPQLACPPATVDTAWMPRCVDEREAQLAARDAQFGSLTISNRVDFRLERNDFQAAKADFDLYMALSVAVSAQDIGAGLSRR